MDVKITPEQVTELELMFGEQEALPCVVENHDEDWEAHGGATNWYMQFGCSSCGTKSRVHPYCDGFRRWCENKWNMLQCPDCDELTAANEAVLICKRIDGSW